jgi:hypothetical protein
MTKHHKATPEQWAYAETCAPEDFAGYACILELRNRVAALEAAQQPQQDKLDRLIALDRDDPANSLVERIATDAELCKVYNEKTTLRAVYDLGRQHGAALAQPEPKPPTDEELYELWNSEGIESDFQDCRRFARAYAARYGTPTIQPVPVSERLPEPSVKVLAHYLNALGKGRTICAIWVPAKSRSDEGDLDADDFLEYDEESDKYHWPEGWYEAIENWEELGWAKVYEGEIAYWQPLPQWPATALSTPEAPNV